MPAMTNPEGYFSEYYDPENPTKQAIMGHSTEENIKLDGYIQDYLKWYNDKVLTPEQRARQILERQWRNNQC